MATVTVVTNAGKALITGRLKGTGNEPKYIGMGTGADTASEDDTALSTEVETRTNGTSTQEDTNSTDDTYQVVGTITATAARAVTNAGLLDASSTGTLAVKSSFDVINLDTDDAIEFTFQVVFDNA